MASAYLCIIACLFGDDAKGGGRDGGTTLRCHSSAQAVWRLFVDS